MEILLPVKGCVVKRFLTNGDTLLGWVDSVNSNNSLIEVNVDWKTDRGKSLVPLSELHNGFMPGMDVQDVPNSRTRKPLGEGVVLKTRILGGKMQVLVDFLAKGKQLWLPYENLKQIMGAKSRFILGSKGAINSAEQFRLKSLAHALEMWNENTGSLSHIDIDPLPHQIHLVHHILASGNLNWLIADDVGLGKTIETGMLLAALKQRGSLKRVLLVTPAGLTKQWQDELNNKFKMGDFRIYDEEFHIKEPRHWKMYDYVIASIDKLKNENHLELLLQADAWDLVVFDEAHRLSRRQYGLKLKSSKRYQLAANLRNNTDAMILLSGTPHQGMHDKFKAILELLHPERKDEINTLALNPEIIGEMVFRNNKADVTDAEGNFIFKGKTTKAITVHVSNAVLEFDKNLQHYLKKGYDAGSSQGAKGNAIGFVMTVYRKLAASSVAAIHNALLNRRVRLEGEVTNGVSFDELDDKDQRYLGEWEEQLQTDAQEFFEGEIELLNELIVEAEKLRVDDKKIQYFIEQLISNILEKNKDEKVLIFTEYRTTQNYIKEQLGKHFGYNKVELINGSMSHQLRQQSIAHFEDKSQFLISTEAGGEGINLQRNCHIMVNYDLPWNPMRLVQRIGRLYRYGQKKRVVVFNVHSPDTADEQIISIMYARIEQVVSDMAGVGNEYNERMQDDILGEIADMMDVREVLEEAVGEGIQRTQERIDEALNKARAATSQQRELFEHVASFDPNETHQELSITSAHSTAFVLGMFQQLNIEIVESTHNELIWHIRLSEDVQKELSTSKSRYTVTIDRILATSRPDTHMLDLDSFLMKYLIRKAQSYKFKGQSAVIQTSDMQGQALLTSLLRWQNDQGRRLRQEYTAYSVSRDGKVNINPHAFSDWLKQPAETGNITALEEQNIFCFEAAEAAADKRLKKVSNLNLHPENNQWVSTAWLQDN